MPKAMSDNTLIKVEGISKKFCRSLKKSLWYGVKDLTNEIRGKRHGGNGELRPDEFWAVRDVSFELKRGQCLGLIGRNGAGKTTLLRLLNGLVKPDRGKAVIKGRVGAIIALGAGFNPILTGRENIYVNGAVLGFSKKDLHQRLEEIIEFAELGEFIDTPVQNYSSGMSVRLGFSIASSLEPDLLFIDEVLAVGDVKFRAKCANKIDNIRDQCATVFVSHSMEQISRICTSALVMEKGLHTPFKDVFEGIQYYNNLNTNMPKLRHIHFFPPVLSADIRLLVSELAYGGDTNLEITIATNEEVQIWWRIIVRDMGGNVVAESDSRNSKQNFYVCGKTTKKIILQKIQLVSGCYALSMVLLSEKGDTLVVFDNFGMLTVLPSIVGNSKYQIFSVLNKNI